MNLFNYLYRCFVSRAQSGEWKCHNEQRIEVSQGRARSSSELKDLKCIHITKVLEEKLVAVVYSSHLFRKYPHSSAVPSREITGFLTDSSLVEGAPGVGLCPIEWVVRSTTAIASVASGTTQVQSLGVSNKALPR